MAEARHIAVRAREEREMRRGAQALQAQAQAQQQLAQAMQYSQQNQQLNQLAQQNQLGQAQNFDWGGFCNCVPSRGQMFEQLDRFRRF